MIKLKVEDYMQDKEHLVSKIEIRDNRASRSEFETSLRVLLFDYLENYEEININTVLQGLKQDFIERKASKCL